MPSGFFSSAEFILFLDRHSEAKWPNFCYELQVALLASEILLFAKCPLFPHLKHFMSLFLSFEVTFLSIIQNLCQRNLC